MQETPTDRQDCLTPDLFGLIYFLFCLADDIELN